MTARNLKALAYSQVTREEIRQLLLAHHPLAEPLRAKAIAPKLTRRVSLSAIAWHLRAIWAAHTLQTEQSNSGAASATVATANSNPNSTGRAEQ